MVHKKCLFPLTILISSFIILGAVIFYQAAKAKPVLAGTACLEPLPGMVSWWPGDGSAEDIRGGNDGSLVNGTTYASGKVGQAFSFDGSNDGLLVPDAPSLNFGEGADFSLDAWIRLTPNAPSPSTNLFTILSKRFAPTDTAKPTGFELFLFEGKLGFQLADDSEANGSYQNFYAPSPDLRDGNFHHVAVTLDRGVTDGGRLYVDGQVVLIFNANVELGDLSTTEPLRIGIHATNGVDAFFNGLIDEIEIFNRSLTPTEVLGIYNAGSAGKCKEFSTFLPMIVNPCQGHYFDNFSNSNSGWPSNDDSTSQTVYLGGEYRILVKPSESWSAVRPGVQATNLRVSVDVRNVTGVGGTYGLIFGLAEDWTQFYTFEIEPTGDYVIWQADNGNWTVLTYGSANQINTGTASNHLQIERNGSQIKAFANGQLLTTVTDGSFVGERRVGLITSTFEQENVDARFDNFEVCSFSGPLNVLGTVPQNGQDIYYNAGKVGIGVNNPGASLHIASRVRNNPEAGIKLSNSQNPGGTWRLIPGITGYSRRGFSIEDVDAGHAVRLAINENGWVGIGTPRPLFPMHVVENISNGAGVAFFEGKVYADDLTVGGTRDPNKLLVLGDLDVHGGYIKLDQSTGVPSATDCNSQEEIGRMKVDTFNTNLYICTRSGWVTK